MLCVALGAVDAIVKALSSQPACLHTNHLHVPVPLIPGALTGVSYAPLQGVPQETCKHPTTHSTGNIC